MQQVASEPDWRQWQAAYMDLMIGKELLRQGQQQLQRALVFLQLEAESELECEMQDALMTLSKTYDHVTRRLQALGTQP